MRRIIKDVNKNKAKKSECAFNSYTILMPPIFYHLKTRYFVKNHQIHIPAKFVSKALTVSDRNKCEMFFLD
jgi:hypothetical protein